MIAFWDSVIQPLLETARPRSVVLVGGGDLALRLLEATGGASAIVHVIDRAPRFDVAAATRGAGDRLVVHRAGAADAIGLLPVPDLLMIDGDANWHSVQAMLHAAQAQAVRTGSDFPLTFVANVAWPCGRRDRYDDPAAIPEAFRHPHEKAGVTPGKAALGGGGGLFADRYHAAAENEPRNGVLTALEDFVAGEASRFGFIVVPMLHGLGVVYSRRAIDSAAVRAIRDQLAMGPGARRVAVETERARVELAAETADLRRAGVALQYRNDALHRELRAEQRATAKLRQSPSEAEALPVLLRMVARRVAVAAKHRVAGRAMEARHQRASEAQAAADIARIERSPIFDADWYLRQYRDVAENSVTPAAHYYHHGAAEGRDPGPAFSTAFYLANNPDVAEAGHNPLLHYLTNGATEGRDPGPDFDTRDYLRRHPDLLAPGVNPLEHFLGGTDIERRGKNRVE